MAVAQYPMPNITFTGEVSPTKGGTKKKPKRASLRVAFTVNKESRVTADQIVFFLPEHAYVNGTGFRFCTSTQIATNGVASCPRGSVIGTGTASAVLGPNQTPVEFKLTAFFGSKNALTVYLEQTNGSIKVPLNGPITDAGKPFGQQITVNIPEGVSRPAPNFYSQITGVDFTLNGSTTKKVKVKRKGKKARRVTKRFNAVNLRGCPSDRTHDAMVRLRFIPNPNPPQQATAQQGDTQACSR